MTAVWAKVHAFMKSPASRLVVLAAVVGAYGIGYWRGNSARAHTTTTVTDRSTNSAKEEQTQRGSVAHIYGNEDVLETRLTMPPITLPDGSVRQQTRVSREIAKNETVQAVDTSKTEVKIVERIVEKKVPVQGPCPAQSSPFAEPALPRFLAGPAVGRDFHQDKYIFGGTVAVRLGPVWVRAAADTRPAVVGSMEVPF